MGSGSVRRGGGLAALLIEIVEVLVEEQAFVVAEVDDIVHVEATVPVRFGGLVLSVELPLEDLQAALDVFLPTVRQLLRQRLVVFLDELLLLEVDEIHLISMLAFEYVLENHPGYV